MEKLNLKFLQSLATQYPSVAKACTEIINLQAILNLPKETEHFVSDVHGEYEQFLHILKTGSGAKKIYITDVFEESSKALVEDINKNFAPVAEFCPAGDFSKVKEATVVLNASGIGMGSHIGENPLPKEFISKDQFYFDACYNPAKTQFLLDAEEAGATILNGLGMSLYQGAAQIEYWTGQEPPIEAMRQKLLDIISEK